MSKTGTKDITAIGFKGMSNLMYPSSTLVDKQTGLITPGCILNADITNGVLTPREGYRKVANLTKPHSLWSDGRVMFCVAQGASPQTLYRCYGENYEAITALPDAESKMSYVRVDEKVYISNSYWKGIYDLQASELRSWGIDLPVSPQTILVDGDLVPGHYSLCYTKVNEDGRIGGNGPIVDLFWDSGNRGISLVDVPERCVAWITHPDGSDFFLATVTNDTISSMYGVQKLPTRDVIPPPFLQHCRHTFGRIWGANGNRVYYSDPFWYDNFRLGNFFQFDQDVTLIAPISDGIYVGTRKKTYFLEGKDPSKMSILREMTIGAIPGSLSYGFVAGGGYQVSRKLSLIEAAIWNSENGIVMGVQGGHTLYLTDGVNNLYPRANGATLTRVKNQNQQIIATSYGLPLEEDIPSDLAFFLERGTIINRPTDLTLTSTGGFVLGGKIIQY